MNLQPTKLRRALATIEPATDSSARPAFARDLRIEVSIEHGACGRTAARTVRDVESRLAGRCSHPTQYRRQRMKFSLKPAASTTKHQSGNSDRGNRLKSNDAFKNTNRISKEPAASTSCHLPRMLCIRSRSGFTSHPGNIASACSVGASSLDLGGAPAIDWVNRRTAGRSQSSLTHWMSL